MIDSVKTSALTWYHIMDPSEEDLQFLRDRFHFHPLDIEDCKSQNQRSKIDIYEDYYFMILHFPDFDRYNRFLLIREIKIFWGPAYIITIGKSPWLIKSMFEQAKNDPGDEILSSGSSDKLLYRVIERIMKETLTILSRLGHEVDYLSSELFSKKAVRTIENISITRKNIILLDTIFKPQLRVFHKFESGEVKGFAENMEEYWGNILDYYQKIWDIIEDYEELIEGLSKTFDSLQANKTNEIMKVLTFISTTLLPLTFITGLYGMNVGLPLGNYPYSFWILIGIMTLIVGTLMLYFKRKKWL